MTLCQVSICPIHMKTKVTIRSIQTPRDLYNQDGYVGTCYNEYDIQDVRLQIAKQSLEGYYFLWNNIHIFIRPNGELECCPKGFILIGDMLTEILHYKMKSLNGKSDIINPSWEQYCEIGNTQVVKYRVKVPCYHYNTGNADNYSYKADVDFDTLEEAQVFLSNVNEQYKMEAAYENRDIVYEVYQLWEEEFESKWYTVEDGYVTGYSKLYKFIPEQEIEI